VTINKKKLFYDNNLSYWFAGCPIYKQMVHGLT